MGDYGWLITHDHISEPHETSEVGRIGPPDITPELEANLKTGDGARFKMYDDDDELYYEGLLIGDWQGLEPLDDYGAPNAGCTMIKVMVDGKWLHQ